MAEAKTLEAREERHSRASAPRRRPPLEKAPGENLIKKAERWMGRAIRLRNTDAHKAIRAAENAAGFYLAASKKAFSERAKADCLVCAGKAISLAASICEKMDMRRAGRMHGDAGHYFFAGARNGTMPEAEVKDLAREQYELALKFGGDMRILKRKIAMCGRGSGL